MHGFHQIGAIGEIAVGQRQPFGNADDLPPCPLQPMLRRLSRRPMKRAGAAKSCGSTVSAKSKSALDRGRLPPGQRLGNHEFVCGEQKYRLTREDSEFRQYRGRGATILV